MPGNVLLSHVLRQSTIGAEGLDFRVRNGIGYYPFAIITRLIGYIFIKVFCKHLNLPRNLQETIIFSGMAGKI